LIEKTFDQNPKQIDHLIDRVFSTVFPD